MSLFYQLYYKPINFTDMNKTKLFLLLALCSLFVMPSCIINCEDDDDVSAFFTTDYNEYAVGETVYFDNRSHHANNCWWDFDDGYTSDRYNPEHYFSEPGTYLVRLKAYNDGDVDEYTKKIYIHK